MATEDDKKELVAFSVSLRLKPDTDVYKIYQELLEIGYSSPSKVLKDALYALYQKEFPEKIEVIKEEKVFERRILKD